MLLNADSPFLVFLSAFGVSAFAGMATYLRFSRGFSGVGLFSAMSNAGVLGLAIALIWYQKFRSAENIYGLIGICILAGMGGSTVTDVLWSVLSGAGIKVTITHTKPTEGTDD